MYLHQRNVALIFSSSSCKLDVLKKKYLAKMQSKKCLLFQFSYHAWAIWTPRCFWSIASKFIPGLALRHAAIPSWKVCSCSTASGEYCVNQGSSGSIGLYCIHVYLQPPSVEKSTHHKTAPLKTHSEILDLEYENLADQVLWKPLLRNAFYKEGLNCI